MEGTLYLVATPIGNYDDITLRALTILKEADVIVYEEHKEGTRLLRHYGIEKTKTYGLNEHNEIELSKTLLAELKEGYSVALISDAGTPVFSDPGLLLVQHAIANKIKIIPLPGASSLLPALIVSGFSLKQFTHYGFLSPKKEQRLAELQKIKKDSNTLILMDTPYRLKQLLHDVNAVMGDSRKLCLAFDLTLPTEEIMHGTAGSILKTIGEKEKKGEFVLVVGPMQKGKGDIGQGEKIFRK